METGKKTEKPAGGNLSQRFQYGLIILQVLLIVVFALYVPPEYGVFILIAFIAVFFLWSRKKKKNSIH